MLTADQEGGQGLESWDLSVFRFPRPEKWKNTTVNEKVKTLELQFRGEEGMCRQRWSLQASADKVAQKRTSSLKH